MVENGRGDAGAFDHFTPYPEFASNPDAVSGPVAPFIYRPAIPYLASLLPFGVAASLALVNLVLVVAGLWFLVDALRGPVAVRRRRRSSVGSSTRWRSRSSCSHRRSTSTAERWRCS